MEPVSNDRSIPARLLDAWPVTLGALIAGVSHELSNRVATLAGVCDILAGEPSVPPVLRALVDEVPKLEEALRLLRLLAPGTDPAGNADGSEAEEPLEPVRVVYEAIALASIHPSVKGTEYEVLLGQPLPPVVARPVGLTHALVVALVESAVGKGPDPEAGPATGGVVRIRFEPGAGDLAIIVGGEPVMRLPVLSRVD